MCFGLFVKSISLHASVIVLPDILVFLPPPGHQIGADEDKTTARITGHVMASADVKEPGRMAVNARDICETLSQMEVARKTLGFIALGVL